jgi:polar amino acid transport system permease protein
MSGPVPGSTPTTATTVRQWAQARGRTFPLPSAEEVPWWIVVLLILGLVIFYSVTTSETYSGILEFIANGIGMTLRLTVAAFIAAVIIGLVAGLARVSKTTPEFVRGLPLRLGLAVALAVVLAFAGGSIAPLAGLSQLGFANLLLISLVFFLAVWPLLTNGYTMSTLYVEVARGVPLLVWVFYFNFVVAPLLRDNFGIFTSDFTRATMSLAFGYGAYLAEIFRAGIQSIPRGQMEAARSLGMGYAQAMRYVILPQAIRTVLPPLGNDFVAMLKDTSLVYAIGVTELTMLTRQYAARTFLGLPVWTTAALVYLILTLLLSFVVRYIERRFAIAK